MAEPLTISATEYVVDEDRPTLDGEWIRNVLILGRESKNPFNATRTSPGDPTAPRRKFNLIINSAEEVAKFNDKPSYMLHKPAPRKDDDLIGTFENPRAANKGLRMDFKCRKIAGTEEYVPQVVALRDNIAKKRPFGGFSPTFDFTVNPDNGEVQTIIACESIDLVPTPASVKSAVESDALDIGTDLGSLHEKHDALRKEHEELKKDHEELKSSHESYIKAHEGLVERHNALESECHEVFSALKEKGMSDEKAAKTANAQTSGSESVQRSDPPAPPKKIETKATNFAEFVRS